MADVEIPAFQFPHPQDVYKRQTLNQRCPDCGKAVLQGEQSVDQYDAYVGRRRGWTFAAVVVLGIIPLSLGTLLRI